MKAQLPQPSHYSYQIHRRQMIRQIVLPVVLASLLMIALVVLIVNVTFSQGSGDVARWAAISTMWILILVMVAGILVLAILGGLIYLLIFALSHLPHYSAIAQDYVFKARGYIIRGANM